MLPLFNAFIPAAARGAVEKMIRTPGLPDLVSGIFSLLPLCELLLWGHGISLVAARCSLGMSRNMPQPSTIYVAATLACGVADTLHQRRSREAGGVSLPAWQRTTFYVVGKRLHP